MYFSQNLPRIRCTMWSKFNPPTLEQASHGQIKLHKVTIINLMELIFICPGQECTIFTMMLLSLYFMET